MTRWQLIVAVATIAAIAYCIATAPGYHASMVWSWRA